MADDDYDDYLFFREKTCVEIYNYRKVMFIISKF